MIHLQTRDLRITYQGAAGRVEALAGFDLAVKAGEPVAVIGPSGCGKSTLLLALAGLVPANSGDILVGGEPAEGPRLRTSLVLQDFGLLPWKSVIDNAALGLRLRGISRSEAGAKALSALRDVGIDDFAHAFPGELSGGMRQRLAIARTLALDADLLLMDEPLSALDALTRESLQDLLLALWNERRHTTVLVTHSIEEAVFLGRRIVVMSKRPGRVEAIIDNPGMGSSEFRESEGFLAQTARLRHELAAVGAR